MYEHNNNKIYIMYIYNIYINIIYIYMYGHNIYHGFLYLHGLICCKYFE